MIKLVIVCECMAGGVRRHIIDILKSLPYDKYKIYLIYSSYRADKTFFEEFNHLDKRISFYDIKEMKREINLKDDIISFVKIVKILKMIAPDIVHCHSSKAGATGRVAAKVLSVNKILYTPHAYVMQSESLSKIKKNVYLLIEMLLSRFCTTLTINVSKGEKNFAITNKIDNHKKFQVVYNGIPYPPISQKSKENLKKEFGIIDDDIVIGVAARFDDQKDPFTFLKIAKRIISKHKNVKFINSAVKPLAKACGI